MVALLMDVAVAPGLAWGPERIAGYAATLPVLVALCTPNGQELDALPGESDLQDDWETDEARALDQVRTQVFDNLRMLTSFGLIPAVRGRVSVPAGLRPAIANAIGVPGAPFRFRLEPGAIPLPEPESDG